MQNAYCITRPDLFNT